MDDLISRRALYERAATLEAQALDYVGKLIERDGEETSVEWRIWSAILTERTAFKHDVYDAPSVNAEREKGKWIYYPKASGSVTSTAVHLYPVCSECGCEHPIANYCPNCGAKMEED